METLDQIQTNVTSRIKSLKNHVLSPKLTDMGLFPGKEIKILFKAPFGDPIAVQVDNFTLSLRKDEAQLIEIEVVK